MARYLIIMVALALLGGCSSAPPAGSVVGDNATVEDRPTSVPIDLDEILGYTPKEYDVKSLLAYRGPSSRTMPPIQNPRVISAYVSSDKTRRIIDILLSSHSISYFTLTTPGRFDSTPGYLNIVVPYSRRNEAGDICFAAETASLIEMHPDFAWFSNAKPTIDGLLPDRGNFDDFRKDE